MQTLCSSFLEDGQEIFTSNILWPKDLSGFLYRLLLVLQQYDEVCTSKILHSEGAQIKPESKTLNLSVDNLADTAHAVLPWLSQTTNWMQIMT